jgi:hypothetical protein
MKKSRVEPFEFAGHKIELGETLDTRLPLTQTYSGANLTIPVRIMRGAEPGPALFVLGAIHGDEINGAGVVREIILDEAFQLSAGTLLLAPVINAFGYERHSRYLPDRRDLNRHFPGFESGSPASRLAHAVFAEIVSKCDYGVDLHTAAVRRTNFPNVRADLSRPEIESFAWAFGCELVVNGKGPKGSLRRTACRAGRPTIILEAGEVWKIEPRVVEVGVRGVRNALIHLGMMEGKPALPAYQARVDKTKWLRADYGGILQFHVAPGDVVEAEQPLATNSNLLGKERNVLYSPFDGVILGMTTIPVVTPGDPVCHVALPADGIAQIRKALRRGSDQSLHERLREDLATNISVSERLE